MVVPSGLIEVFSLPCMTEVPKNLGYCQRLQRVTSMITGLMKDYRIRGRCFNFVKRSLRG